VNEERDRQLERAREALAEKEDEARAKAEEDKLASAERTPDDQSVRAKSTGHGKTTADKWNQ
jgi:hypothetical protein